MKELLTTRTVTRKRTFEAKTTEDLKHVVDKLCQENHTGPVRIEMSQGGIRTVIAEDHATLAGSP
jgi:hypothetical protein